MLDVNNLTSKAEKSASVRALPAGLGSPSAEPAVKVLAGE